jgi:hypothetical protein
MSSTSSTELYNTRPNSISPVAQLSITTLRKMSTLSSVQHSTNSLTWKLSLIYHTAVSIVMLPFSVVLLQQIHCYPIGLLRYYGNATNSFLCNRHCYVTIEMPETHCYATATVALLWKCYRVHRSCHQGNPTCNIASSLRLLVPSIIKHIIISSYPFPNLIRETFFVHPCLA